GGRRKRAPDDRFARDLAELCDEHCLPHRRSAGDDSLGRRPASKPGARARSRRRRHGVELPDARWERGSPRRSVPDRALTLRPRARGLHHLRERRRGPPGSLSACSWAWPGGKVASRSRNVSVLSPTAQEIEATAADTAGRDVMFSVAPTPGALDAL